MLVWDAETQSEGGNTDAFSGVEILMGIAILAVRVSAAHKLKSEAQGFTSV